MLPEYITSLADVSFHTVGLHVRAVSVFKKKSDAICGFLAYFCAVLRFQDPPSATLLTFAMFLLKLSTLSAAIFLFVSLVLSLLCERSTGVFQYWFFFQYSLSDVDIRH